MPSCESLLRQFNINDHGILMRNINTKTSPLCCELGISPSISVCSRPILSCPAQPQLQQCLNSSRIKCYTIPAPLTDSLSYLIRLNQLPIPSTCSDCKPFLSHLHLFIASYISVVRTERSGSKRTTAKAPADRAGSDPFLTSLGLEFLALHTAPEKDIGEAVFGA